MSFISYAQNFEDVVLWRALKHIPKGFYIDVGANDPQDDSVTKAFYDRGWSGINCEPLQRHCDDLNRERLRDINLRVALGDAEGEIELWDCDVRGWATFDQGAIEAHEASGVQGSLEVVPLTTLTQVCDTHVIGDIHFVKIDVEGAEAAVLRGMDFAIYRPWIMVVEAMAPDSQSRGYEAWEDMLLNNAYQFVYFDGLNRFYVAKEHPELVSAFAVPPNCFDDFVLQRQAEAEKKAVSEWEQRVETERKAHALWQRSLELEKSFESEQERTESLKAALAQSNYTLEQAQRTIHDLLSSRSWRITAPLRWLANQVRLLKAQGLDRRAFSLLKKLARWVGIYEQLVSFYRKLTPNHVSANNTSCGRQNLSAAFLFNPVVLPAAPSIPESNLMPAPVTGATDDVWIRVVGHIEGHFSLAIVNRALAVALEAVFPGRVIFSPYNDGPIASPTDIPEEQKDIIQLQLQRSLPTESENGGKVRVVSIAHHYPIVVDTAPADLRLVVFFWEETNVPREAVEKLNQNFDVILVAALFVKRALRNSGCFKPIVVIPMGLDHLLDALPSLGQQGTVAADDTNESERNFRFLHISSFFPRKGPDVLLNAFFKAFSAEDEVELYIKTFKNPHNEVHTLLEQLRKAYPNGPKVVVDETSLTSSQMLNLYTQADAVVLPARGEGFNLPAAESLALGVPLVVTGNGAQLDFATLSTATLIPYQFAYSSSHVQSDASCWFEPDVEQLATLMRALRVQVAAGDEEILRHTRLGGEFVRENYRWAKAADAVEKIVDGLVQSRPPGKPKLALVSSWNCRCGIAEYAKNLVSEVRKQFDLQVYCDDRTLGAEAGENATVAWTIGDQSIEAVLQDDHLAKADVILIQHQPSLFRLSEVFCEALARLAESGKVVALELHATKPLLSAHRPSSAAIDALRRVTRLIVHNVDGMNHLLSLGLADNVFILPHGVVNKKDVQADQSVREQLGLGENDILLGTFGFALPHKGIDQVIAAIKPLEEATGRRVGLLAVNAVLDDRSGQTIKSWQKLAQDSGVANQITWVTDYRPIDVCINMLAATDYVVYPYRDTEESASGAVTIGLSSGKPVLVSDSPIFDELKSCCYNLGGSGSDEIVATVTALMARASAGEAIVGLQSDWLVQRSWQSVSSRLSQMFTGLLEDLAFDAEQPKQQSHSTKRLFVDVSELYRRDAKTGIQRVVHSILSELLLSPPAGFDVYPVFSESGDTYFYTSKFCPSNTRMLLWDQHEIQFQAGDVFLGLDLTAHLFPAVERLLERFKATGVQIAYVLYDILPVTHPQYFPEGMQQPFERWMTGMAKYADTVLAISKHSAQQYRDWLAVHAPDSSVQVGFFHLGSDFIAAKKTLGLPQNFSGIRALLTQGFTCISVGTLEPRKGYDQILSAFDLVWGTDPTANLVLIGKAGWKTEALVHRIRNHPMLDKHLFWFESASDECLEACYEASDYLIAASFEEGFGLPIVEALQRNVPVLARDIPVFREIAGTAGVGFYSGGASDLANAILKAKQSPLVLEAGALEFVSWSGSKDQLINGLGL